MHFTTLGENKIDGEVTLFFENHLWIRGRIANDGFNIYDMYYGSDSSYMRKKYANQGNASAYPPSWV